MIIGHDQLIKSFKELAKEDRLSHGYILFGEPSVGKFRFALSLASYLEKGEFDEPTHPLTETFIIRPSEEGPIGINNVREAKYFLLKKPVNSSRRVVIIDEAEKLTSQAEHAILKIAEEPPLTSLIILILPNPESLLPTIQSRFQKVYFPRVKSDLIVRLLMKKINFNRDEAALVAEISFGRPGRAIQLAGDEKSKERRRKALGLLRKRGDKRGLIEELTEGSENLELFFTDLVAELSKDPIKNHEVLKSILSRLTKISQFTTNKRLQLEAALWNI